LNEEFASIQQIIAAECKCWCLLWPPGHMIVFYMYFLPIYFFSFLCLLGWCGSKKSPRLHHFRLDRDEIWQDCSPGKSAL